jgi:GNAT superfamily N-acetyltransferase
MVAYRFCRSDDIPLLVDGYNRCWRAHFPEDPELDRDGFKRWIRDIQLWTSSCMVASDDEGPLGVLLGGKRDDATLIWRLAVHPRHQRRGHARHLLTSLSSKLAILGPPTLKVELPDSRPELGRVFAACGYSVTESQATTTSADWFLERSSLTAPPAMVIPFTVDDLLANDLFDPTIRRSWERGLPSLEAQSNEVSGLAVASFEGIEAFLLARQGDPDEIVSFGSTEAESAEANFRTLLAAWVERRGRRVSIPKLTDDEIPRALLLEVGFRKTASYREWSTTAQAA